MAKQVNRKQLEEIGEVWFQRANKLRDYWQNELNPREKRLKALNLCFMMNCRLVNVVKMNMELNSIYASKFQRGGI